VIFGDAGITSKEFAEKFVSGVLKGTTGTKPPCAGGSRDLWTAQIKVVVENLGHERGFDHTYEWLVDWIWWSGDKEHLGLALESELDKNPKAVEDDFYKLTVLKCPLKVLVYSANEPEEMKRRAEEYLKRRSQHVEGEEYLLIAFTPSKPRCFSLRIPAPADGRCNELQFIELQLSAASAVA